MGHKLIPSFVNPLTHFYIVPLSGPDRAVELVAPAAVPMAILDLVTDEWWGSPAGGRWIDRIGPFSTSNEAVDAAT